MSHHRHVTGSSDRHPEWTVLFIGRFQPFHNGHYAVLKSLLFRFKRVIIVIGSAQASHDPKNPLTCGERIELIERILAYEHIHGVTIVPIADCANNREWVARVFDMCPHFDAVLGNNPLVERLFMEARVPIVGTEKFEREKFEGRRIRENMLHDRDSWRAHLHPEAVSFIEERGVRSRAYWVSMSDAAPEAKTVVVE